MKNQSTENGPGAAYQALIILLTIYALLIAVFLYLIPIDQQARRPLIWIDFLISLVFLFDFFRTLRQAYSPLAYLRWGWLDLIGSLPGLPILRLARIPRAVSLATNLRQKRLSGAIKEIEQDRAASAVALILFFGLISLSVFSGLVLYFERQAPDANIRSPQDALWWVLVTISTVGYGDFYPVTQAGRFIAVILILAGIGIFGVISSALASWFLRPFNLREQHRQEQEDLQLQQEVAALRKELQALRELLQAEDTNGSNQESE